MAWIPNISFIVQTATTLYSTIFHPVILPECRILPVDNAWPTVDVWDSFNRTIDGRLIKTVPLGTPCHYPTYDAGQCEYVRTNWRRPELHEESPSSIMDPIFLNKSCDPFGDPDSPCSIGSYVQFTVNVSKPEHVIRTLEFADQHNIRFVVKNTGHDYMGRSTGIGGLSVWMHHLRDITYIPDFNSRSYQGPAFKAQAGVLGEEITAAAHEHGLVGVSGECPTVGMVGGYIQGGGHSALSSVFGMGADQTLSFEVVTPTGEFVNASMTENQDLYWALSGGGPGTYGVVWSVTVKAHTDAPSTVALIRFTSEGISQDDYWKAVTSYLEITSRITDFKAFGFATYSAADFFLTPLFAFNRTVEEVKEILHPFTNGLKDLKIQYMYTVNQFPTYADAFKSVPAFDVANTDIANFQIGSRILPASIFDNNASLLELKKIVHNVADAGGAILDITVKPSLEAGGYPNNAVLPAWRNALKSMGVILPLFNEQSLQSITEDQHKVTWTFTEPLRKLAPESGAYMNEASIFIDQ
ncbi:hypothetical protein VKT23_016600 [Stygiomarasmius scandens]|uniref:FAD-binding PCMH-type domain-containing protein n=1 Tax=Marasmiellus scandens TaxID=2682957 RepID=A0ABR1IUA4_9AGAR